MNIAFAVFDAASQGAVVSITRRQCEALAAAGHLVTVVTDRTPTARWNGVRFVESEKIPNNLIDDIFKIASIFSRSLVFKSGWAPLDMTKLYSQFTKMKAIEHRLSEIVLADGIDLCLCCQHAMALNLNRIRSRLSVPFAIVSHGDIFSHPLTSFSLPLREFYRRGAVFAYKNANCVYSVSRSMANTALGNGCPESRSVVARSGVDPAEIGWPPLQPCTRGPSQRLLSVGRLAPEKGHEVAIRALALLKDLDVELVIVGDGPCLSSLKEQAFELGVMDRCEFVGYLERRALGAQYGAADLAIQPSISEASGLAVIEALVTGTPVVASRIGGVPEIITDGSDGLLVPPRSPSELATAVRSLLEVPERLDCMRANAAARARDFHWDTLLSQWVKDVETRFQRK